MPAQDDQFESQDRTQLTAGGEASALAGEFAAGEIVGGSYEVVSFIGAGGMGNVYRVRHTIMQTEYALKTLSAEKVTEVAWRRFQNEAQAIARMNHPNVVAIYNLGFHQDRLPYYVMDLLAGKTLADIIREKGHLETNEALGMFIEVCAGIGYAHKKGIVHRDIKPPNIVLLDKPDPSGARVKIVDFGIAKLSHTKDLANQQLTNVGEVCGSPFYMSPEQCAAGKIDTRSDIYSLGCTLFEALTGSPPFKGRNAMETMLLHNSATPPTLQAGSASLPSTDKPATLQAASGGIEFPPLLEIAIAKTLAKAPMDRYQNMESLAGDLTAVLQGSKSSQLKGSALAPSKINPSVLMAAVVAILLIAAGGICWFNGARQKSLTAKAHASNEIFIRAGTATNNGSTQSPAAPVKPGDMTPFSKIVTKDDGKTYLHFSFPDQDDIGTIWTWADKKRLGCRGDTIELPTGIIVFSPGNAFVDHPEYFKRFGEGDLAELELEGVQFTKKAHNGMLKDLPHLKGLKNLIISNCEDIDNNVLGYIEQLPNLDRFICDESNISVVGLSQSSILGRLVLLKVCYSGSISPLLRALKGSPKLIALEMPNADLTNSDYQLIGTMTNLQVLNCGQSGLQDRDLMALTNLKHLKNLDAEQNTLTAAAIPALKKIFGGRKGDLDIRSPYINPGDFLTMKKALPAVEFEENRGRVSELDTAKYAYGDGRK